MRHARFVVTCIITSLREQATTTVGRERRNGTLHPDIVNGCRGSVRATLTKALTKGLAQVLNPPSQIEPCQIELQLVSLQSEYVFHAFQMTSQRPVFCRIPPVFHVFHGIRRIPSSKNGRIPYKIFLAPRIHTVGSQPIERRSSPGYSSQLPFWGSHTEKQGGA